MIAAALAAATVAAWSAPATVPGSATGFPFPVTAATGADGTAAVVWRRGGDVPSTASVHVAVRGPSGRWRSRALTGRTVGVAAPRVAVDDRGRVVVTWVEMHRRADGVTHAPFRVRVATRDRRGRWHAARTLGESGNFVYAAPDVAVNGDGSAVVVWRGIRRTASGDKRRALLAASRRPGHAFGPAVEIRDPGAAVSVGPRVALDAHRRATVVWTGGAQPRVRVATRSAAGRWTAGSDLGTAPGSEPRIAADAAGDVTVAWRQAQLDSEGNGSQWGSVAVAQRPAGGVFGAPVTLGDVPTPGPLVAMSPAGQAFTAWPPAPSDPMQTPALHYAAAAPGAGFGAPAGAPGPPAEALAVLADGTGLAASAGGGRITVRELPPAGAPGGPAVVASTGQSPVIAAAGDHAIVVWLRGSHLRYATTHGG
jgi:hypothetical protein